MQVDINPSATARDLLPALKAMDKRLKACPTNGNANLQKRPRYHGQFGAAKVEK